MIPKDDRLISITLRVWQFIIPQELWTAILWENPYSTMSSPGILWVGGKCTTRDGLASANYTTFFKWRLHLLFSCIKFHFKPLTTRVKSETINFELFLNNLLQNHRDYYFCTRFKKSIKLYWSLEVLIWFRSSVGRASRFLSGGPWVLRIALCTSSITKKLKE